MRKRLFEQRLRSPLRVRSFSLEIRFTIRHRPRDPRHRRGIWDAFNDHCVQTGTADTRQTGHQRYAWSGESMHIESGGDE